MMEDGGLMDDGSLELKDQDQHGLESQGVNSCTVVSIPGDYARAALITRIHQPKNALPVPQVLFQMPQETAARENKFA